MLPIEKLITKTLNRKPTEKDKLIEELSKDHCLLPDPKLAKIAAEAEKALKNWKT